MDTKNATRRKESQTNEKRTSQLNPYTVSSNSLFSVRNPQEGSGFRGAMGSTPMVPARTNLSQTDNMVCTAIDIDRVLTTNEVSLIQQVASTLDGSIKVVTQKRESGMKVILVYDALIMYCVIQSLKTLITGLSTLYTGEQCQESPRSHVSILPAAEAAKGGKSPEPARKQELVKKQEPAKKLESVKKPEVEKKLEIEKKEPASGETSPVDNAGETPDTFERPLSLKGQRHVFLYKCRYNQLKAIIDRTGCWGLRMASLTDKWPCLVVYCAKDRETWMNAFHKIQKLERTDFLRRKIADSLKSVDLKRLEELTNTYGQKNACISLCVQSPSSPSNPSVSVCGIESYVEQLYKIFIEYHLIAEEETDAASTPVSPSFSTYPVYPSQSLFPSYSNDVFMPAPSHPLYTPFSSSMYTPYHAVASDIRDDYNTTFRNPYLDNYPYSQLSSDAMRMPRKSLGLDDGYGASGSFFDAQRVLDDDHFFQDAQDLSTSFRGIMQDVMPMPSAEKSESEASGVSSSMAPGVSSARSPTMPSETQELPRETSKSSPHSFSAESREFVPKENVSTEQTEAATQPEKQSPAGGETMSLLSMGSFVKPHTRRRDDNFELFMDSNGIPDSMTDVMSPGLSFNMQWRDDGW